MLAPGEQRGRGILTLKLQFILQFIPGQERERTSSEARRGEGRGVDFFFVRRSEDGGSGGATGGDEASRISGAK